MMVSKVAVMALVGILAIPILLGYGLNLSEVTVTVYKPDGESVNVTPLLMNDTAYTDSYADMYKINSNFVYIDNPVKPVYSVSTTNTSYPMSQQYFDAGQYPTEVGTFASWNYMYFQCNFDGGGTIYLRVDDTSDGTYIIHAHVYSIYWDLQTKTLNIAIINGTHTGISNSYSYTLNTPSDYQYQFIIDAAFTSTGYMERSSVNGDSTYADIAQGYYFDHPLGAIKNIMPDNTKSVLLTVDLNSITDSSYSYNIGFSSLILNLNKTTVNGVPVWSLTNNANSEVISSNLYYDTSRSSNTYQIYVEKEVISPNEIYPNEYNVNYHVDCRYVGDWPILIGSSNYYLNYDYDYYKRFELKQGIDYVQFGTNGSPLTRSPLMRVDQALFPAFSYYIVNNNTYDPANFKTNPSTTLNDIQKYGTSIEFGGQTYTVDKTGNITMGTHSVSVDGIKLESTPVAGGYENKINGTVVSVTADPSTIKFNGLWGLSVSTVATAASSYTHTEWTPGQFAWDGLDHNFLIVGLLTSIGVFIALGIYIRRTKAALWPLLIVCGGAAMLFFVML